MSETPDNTARCGYVAIVGRPNVGKSTLMNTLLGQKISITARRPQTTRHQVLGIKTVPAGQMIFVDTPGLHTDQAKAINRHLNRMARAAMADVDAVVWLLEPTGLRADDEAVGEALAGLDAPLVIVLNKVDLVKDKATLLPLAQSLQERFSPRHLFMLSALKGQGTEDLEAALMELLPFSAPHFDEDQITDRSERFLAAEFIREQLVRQTHHEIPYATTVEIESFKREDGVLRIAGLIWVERESQKPIIIGKGGQTLKRIGSAARRELEKLFEEKVFLQLWVKVREGWADDERALRAFGYND